MTALIDVRDEITVAKNFVAALYMSCRAASGSEGERAALCEVCNAAREKLEAVGEALDELLALDRTR